MSEVFSSQDAPSQPNTRFQFSMASLLILMTAFCIWCVVKARPAYLHDGAAGAIEASTALFFLAAVAIGRWKVFEKAGQPGWGALIPVYNLYLLLRVARQPAWWLVLYAIPPLSLVPLVLVPLGVARHFGKSSLFGAGLIFFGFAFYPILGFSSAQYWEPTYVRYHEGQPYVC